MDDADALDGAACEARAIAHLEAGDPVGALAWAERAAALLGDGGPYNLMGMALGRMGRHRDALTAYAQAAALAPGASVPRYNCAVMAAALGDHAAAIEHAHRAADLDPTDQDPLRLWIRLLIDVGDGGTGALEHALVRLRALAPDDATARHLLAAARGQVTAAAPAQYIVDTFDAIAPGYDAMMLDQLDYRGHRLIAAAVAATGVDRFARAVDLGCGSGLVGAAIRPWVGWLGGVDLAPAMLEQAEARAIYDELHQGDVVEALAALDAPIDLAVAADLLIYLGDLGPLFAAVRARLAAGGRWIFTVEDAGATPVELRTSGRYAHGRDHLARALAAADLALIRAEPAPLRTHLGAPVAGLVISAARR